MKKKIKIIIGILVILIILAILLIPRKYEVNDGGSVEYRALLYEYTKVHRFNEKSDDGFETGNTLKIFGKEIYNNVCIAKINSDPYNNDVNNNQEYTFSKDIENVSINLNLPSDWKYEELQKDENNDFYKYGVKFYKNEGEGDIKLYYYKNMFGVCGTSLTTKNIDLNNGNTATVGYYDYSSQNSSWDYISFGEINRNIVFQNYSIKLEDAEEFLSIVKTLEIQDSNSFVGEIIEAGEKFIIVKPDSNSKEIKSSDKISIGITRPTNGTNDFYVKGNKVKITYNGTILETYPAQISASKIELAN